MKIPNGALELVETSLADLSLNRLPLPLSTRLHNAGKAIRAAKVDRDGLKDTIIKSYLPEETREIPGSSLDPQDPTFPEALGKLNELWASEIEVDAGAPIDLSRLNGVADKVMCKPESLQVLESFGLLLPAATDAAASAGAPPAELRMVP